MDSSILRQNGFEGFVSIANLKANPNQIPQKQGVYVVMFPFDKEPNFLQTGTGGFFKDKDPNVTIVWHGYKDWSLGWQVYMATVQF